MKRETLHLQAGMSIETGKDWNGRFFIAYARNASVFIRCDKELRRFLKLPIKTPSRESLDSWLDSLRGSDAANGGEPLTRVAPAQHAAPSLSQELLATGFGPECHLDESDPNHQTRTII